MAEIDLSQLGAAQKTAAEPIQPSSNSNGNADAKATVSADTSADAAIIDPTTGELVELHDVDQLIDCLERVEAHDRLIYSIKSQVKQAIAALADRKDDAKTVRVRGHRRRAKIEFPGTTWDNSKLKEAWHSYPNLRDQALRIEKIAPMLREVNKMRGESGPPDFEQFKRMILGAEKPSTANPTVTIEE